MALHNHFFFDEPRVVYMHVMGRASPADLARMVKPGVDLIGRANSAPPTTSAMKGSRTEPSIRSLSAATTSS
jgi:Domain of Unknown Function (DUF1259)